MIKDIVFAMFHFFAKLISKLIALPMMIIFGSAFVLMMQFGILFWVIGALISIGAMICVILGVVTHQWLAVVLFGLIVISYGWMVMISYSIISKLCDVMIYFKKKLFG